MMKSIAKKLSNNFSKITFVNMHYKKEINYFQLKRFYSRAQAFWPFYLLFLLNLSKISINYLKLHIQNINYKHYLRSELLGFPVTRKRLRPFKSTL